MSAPNVIDQLENEKEVKMKRFKLWCKQLFCNHNWRHECWTNGIIKTCTKCGKVKSL